MAAHPLETAMDALKSDSPCITDAIKNFTSVLGGQDLVADADKTKQKKPHDMTHLMEIAKVVLKAVNAHDLASPDAWAEKHPQGDDENGGDRIAAITEFRAAHALREHALSAPGAKLTKLFGRRYLRATRIWPDGVGDATAAELARLRFPRHTVDAFLSGWARAIEPSVGTNDAAKQPDEEADHVSELVWAPDFNAALMARRRTREQEVIERRERMDAGESEADAIREALAAEEEERVEDVTEKE